MAAGDRLTPHGREVASAWARIGARLIDVIILGIITSIFVDVNVSGTDLGYVETSDAILAVVIGAAYEILFTALRSATPGKMLLGLEIVRKTDEARRLASVRPACAGCRT